MLKSLEEYVVEMENRSAINEQNAQHLSEDIWTQLQQKENDLQLAAELGKALLEENEKLKKQNDATVEEYSRKLEVGNLISLAQIDCYSGWFCMHYLHEFVIKRGLIIHL